MLLELHFLTPDLAPLTMEYPRHDAEHHLRNAAAPAC
jgi:hypothetical protein